MSLSPPNMCDNAPLGPTALSSYSYTDNYTQYHQFNSLGPCLRFTHWFSRTTETRLSYRRETARQICTSFSARSLIVHFTDTGTIVQLCNRLAKVVLSLSACPLKTMFGPLQINVPVPPMLAAYDTEIFRAQANKRNSLSSSFKLYHPHYHPRLTNDVKVTLSRIQRVC